MAEFRRAGARPSVARAGAARRGRRLCARAARRQTARKTHLALARSKRESHWDAESSTPPVTCCFLARGPWPLPTWQCQACMLEHIRPEQIRPSADSAGRSAAPSSTWRPRSTERESENHTFSQPHRWVQVLPGHPLAVPRSRSSRTMSQKSRTRNKIVTNTAQRDSERVAYSKNSKNVKDTALRQVHTQQRYSSNLQNLAST